MKDKCAYFFTGHCEGCDHPYCDQCIKCDYNFGCEFCFYEDNGCCRFNEFNSALDTTDAIID